MIDKEIQVILDDLYLRAMDSNSKELFLQYIELSEIELNKYVDAIPYTFNNYVEFIMAISKKLIKEPCVYANNNISNAYLQVAFISFDEKDYNSCIAYLDKALKYNPMNVAAMFEMAECHKISGDIDSFYKITEKLYNFIYNVKDLAHYYRNLGYYLVEKYNYSLAKAVYLYSLRYDNNPYIRDEINYIVDTTGNGSLPSAGSLKGILRDKNIHRFISDDNVALILKVRNQLIDEGRVNTNAFKYVEELIKENSEV